LETHICCCVFPRAGVFLPVSEAGSVCHVPVICYLQSYYFSSDGEFFPPKKPSAPPSPTSLEKGRRNSKAWQGRSELEGGGVLRSLTHVGSSLVPNTQAGKRNHKTKMNISGNVILNVASSLVYVQLVRPGDDLGSVVGLFLRIALIRTLVWGHFCSNWVSILMRSLLLRLLRAGWYSANLMWIYIGSYCLLPVLNVVKKNIFWV